MPAHGGDFALFYFEVKLLLMAVLGATSIIIILIRLDEVFSVRDFARAPFFGLFYCSLRSFDFAASSLL